MSALDRYSAVPSGLSPSGLSDAERESVIARLRTGAADGQLTLDEFGDRIAAVYCARTSADLERTVFDLPPVPRSEPCRATRRVVGVFGSTRVRGRWRPARPTRVVAVLGGCQVDLSDAEVDGHDVEIRAVVVLGDIEVLVPEGVAAEVSGFSLRGAKEDRVRQQSVDPDAPIVRVHATAVFGGVTVRTRAFTAGRWGSRQGRMSG